MKPNITKRCSRWAPTGLPRFFFGTWYSGSLRHGFLLWTGSRSSPTKAEGAMVSPAAATLLQLSGFFAVSSRKTRQKAGQHRCKKVFKPFKSGQNMANNSNKVIVSHSWKKLCEAFIDSLISLIVCFRVLEIAYMAYRMISSINSTIT